MYNPRHTKDNPLERFSRGFFVGFRLISKTLGIVSLTVVDVAISGVVLYIIFGNTPYLDNGGLIALGLSLALTAISIQLWSEISRVSKATSWLIVSVIVTLQFIDLYVDLSIMELVYGTGNIWDFLTPAAFVAVPRSPLWWCLTILLGILTIVNEPLVFHILSTTNGSANKPPNNRTNMPRTPERTNNRTNERTNTNGVHERSIDWNKATKDQRRIISYCLRNQKGENYPTSRSVARSLNLSQGLVGATMKKLRDGYYQKEMV